MTYLNHSAFDGKIAELNPEEINEVNGGIWLGLAVGVAVVGLVYIGWERAHKNAD